MPNLSTRSPKDEERSRYYVIRQSPVESQNVVLASYLCGVKSTGRARYDGCFQGTVLR
jgi:hypothetical protein